MDGPRSKSPVWLIVAIIILLLPILYVLSVGPAAWLDDHGVISQGAFDTVYRPLDWLAIKVPVVGRALRSYVSRWEKPPP